MTERTALIIGGTGFVGSHTVREFVDQGYDVTILSRDERNRPIETGADPAVIPTDRSDADALATAADRVSPDVVIDAALFHPSDASAATEIFADVEAYVYVSSGGVYASNEIPKREDATPLHRFDADHAGDETMATYGPRKAECDRIVRAAAERGVPAMAVRPTMIYGPKPAGWDGSTSWATGSPGIQEHHDYWVDRIQRYDRVVVPGDGTAIWHRVYVEDVARALRVVAEDGRPGEAYNVADRRVLTMEDVIELIAESLETDVEVVHASRRELEAHGLTPEDFVLYHHIGSNYPHVLSTCKIATLGWHSTPVGAAMERTVSDSVASDRDGSAFDPGRDAEERLIRSLAE